MRLHPLITRFGFLSLTIGGAIAVLGAFFSKPDAEGVSSFWGLMTFFYLLGAWLVVWAAFTFVLWLATLKAGTRTLQLVFLTLWIAFLLLGLSHLLGEMEILHTIGGYVGGATALLAFYLASAEVLNEAHGKTVLKV